jgi:hypothetical protein
MRVVYICTAASGNRKVSSAVAVAVGDMMDIEEFPDRHI